MYYTHQELVTPCPDNRPPKQTHCTIVYPLKSTWPSTLNNYIMNFAQYQSGPAVERMTPKNLINTPISSLFPLQQSSSLLLCFIKGVFLVSFQEMLTADGIFFPFQRIWKSNRATVISFSLYHLNIKSSGNETICALFFGFRGLIFLSWIHLGLFTLPHIVSSLTPNPSSPHLPMRENTPCITRK